MSWRARQVDQQAVAHGLDLACQRARGLQQAGVHRLGGVALGQPVGEGRAGQPQHQLRCQQPQQQLAPQAGAALHGLASSR
jgi:hypothetical protein